MKLVYRFVYFGIGLLIGSVFVYFIWQEKETSFDYLPNARALKSLRIHTKLYADDAKKSMHSIGLDSLDIADILQNGSIDFGKSTPRTKPCKTYVVNGNPKEKEITLVIKKCDTIITIEKVMLSK